MKVINWNSAENILTIEMPNCNQNENARDAQLYGSIVLWDEGSDEIKGIKDELRKKWSDAQLAELDEISEVEVMELMSVRGMELSIDS